MFGWNFGNQFSWRGQPYLAVQQQPTYNYNPWTSWTQSFSPSNPTTPFGGQQYNLDVFQSNQQVSNAHSSQQVSQGDYMRRLQVLQALGPGAAERIPNWRTMPMNDFLLAAAQLRRGGNVSNPQQPGQRLPVNVVAKSYWEGGERIPVRKVNIWEVGASDQNSWNSAQHHDFYTSFNQGIRGRRYRVSVEWENGRTYQFDHTNDGSNITIWQPNQ